MTETGSIVGTAQYLSPEQARGGEVDQRSDLYSLGIVLYELLTGKTPFEGDTPVEIAMKHLSTPPQPPSKLRSDIPRELDMVVLRALAKDPNERYQSADEMEGDLERVSRGARVAPATKESATQVLRTTPPPVVEPTAATMIAPAAARGGGDVPPVGEEEEERGGERPWWPWVVAALFVVAALIAGFFVWQELSGSKATVPVELYTGEPVAQAEQQIRAAQLVPAVKHGSSERYKQGIVFKQDPAAGVKVEKGGTVTIWASTGKPKVKVPDVKGMQWTQAQQQLTSAGLKPTEHIVPGSPKGQVTATDPPAGASVPQGSTVRVNVYSGPQPVAVPNVVGESLAQATANLNAAGFNYRTTFVPSDSTANTVIHQNPAPGSSVPKGSTVQLQVSNGPPQVSVPSVVGETAGQATHDLEAAGFKVNPQYATESSDPTQNGIVQSQNPAGGSQATKGSIVTITIAQYSPSGTTTTIG
jgi:serine/threonine-protein kinase